MACRFILKFNQPLGTIITAISVALLIIITPLSTASQISSEVSIQEAPIKLGNKTLFFIQDKLFSPSIERRAEVISSNIQKLADNDAIPTEVLKTREVESEAVTIIHAQSIAIMSVSDADAKAVKQTRQALANKSLQIIKNAINEYREERSISYLTRAAIMTAASTILLIIILLVLWNIMPHLYHWLDVQQDRRIPNLRIQNLELLSSQQISALVQGFTKVIHFVVVLSLLYFYLFKIR
jgi:hypothetical protein